MSLNKREDIKLSPKLEEMGFTEIYSIGRI